MVRLSTPSKCDERSQRINTEGLFRPDCAPACVLFATTERFLRFRATLVAAGAIALAGPSNPSMCCLSSDRAELVARFTLVLVA